MPTQRARVTITESDDVARMLDEAGERWPADRAHRARLLMRLAERGAEAIRDDEAARRRDWPARVRELAGAAGPDAYPPGYLRGLRDDWPA